MKSVIIMIDYFGGSWPRWFPLFLESCRYNPTINWLLHSDCPKDIPLPDNVRIEPISYDHYCQMVSKKLGINFQPAEYHKLCDIKPMLGYIHREKIQGYDYYGYGDLDVLWGNIRQFYTPQVLCRNVISTHRWGVSGHLALFKNTPWMQKAFKRVKKWKQHVENPKMVWFDEDMYVSAFNYPWWLPEKGKKILDTLLFWSAKYRNNNYFKEQYTTPLTPAKWHNGKNEHPIVWYWKNGRITNNQDGNREFIYFHFMNYKYNRFLSSRYGNKAFWEGKKKLIYGSLTKPIKGIRIDKEGFHVF